MNEKLLAKERARTEANELISSLAAPVPPVAASDDIPPVRTKASTPKRTEPKKPAAKPRHEAAALSGSLSFIRPVEKEEAKSKRTTIAVRPSVYEKALQKCEGLGLSFNEVINQFLDEFTQ